LTRRDEQFVVWHGPSLESVRIEEVEDRPQNRSRSRNDITEFSWAELRETWVAYPKLKLEDLFGVERARHPPPPP
jgi:hypothetical protein